MAVQIKRRGRKKPPQSSKAEKAIQEEVGLDVGTDITDTNQREGLEELSTLSRRRGKYQTTKFVRMEQLPPDIKAGVMEMYQSGRPVSAIAEMLLASGAVKDIRKSSLTQYLYRYKWEVVDKQAIIITEAITEPKKAQLAKEVAEDLDVVLEVAQLVVIQKTRVAKLLKRENDMPMLFNTLGGEMKTLSGFLQQYANLSFDLGLLRKVPQITRVTHEGEDTVIESEGKSHVQFNVQNTEKVESAAQAFFDALEGGDLDYGDEEDDAP